MRDHFSYLLEDSGGSFFQKAANQAATPVVRPPPAMAKVASKQSAFEKIAGRLARDIEAIQLAGPCGANAGMQKRADRYLDLLLNSEVELTPEEFGEVFDKLAAAAIQGDLDALYAELCGEVDESLHPVVEAELAKVGHDLTSMALLEKEAFLGLLRGGAAAAKGALKYLGGRGAAAAARPLAAAGRAVAKPARAAVKSVKKNAPFVGTKAREARHLRTINAPDKARAELARIQAATQSGGLRGAVAQSSLPAARKNVEAASAKAKASIAKRDTKMREIDKGWDDVPATAGSSAAPKGTTAPRGRDAPSAAQAGQAKTIKAEGERAKASGDAAAATQRKKPELTVLPGGKAKADDDLKGTGTDGPAPKPKADADAPKADAAPAAKADVPAPPGGADGKPPGFMDAWKKATSGGGWSGLSPAEKGALIRGGVTGAIVYRAMTGTGAVTGGEGVI